MDVFKFLSKSSKRTAVPPLQKLPSAGPVTNPQLFGHESDGQQAEQEKRSRKRKRGQVLEDKAAQLPAEIDFFGGVPQVGGKKRQSKVDREAHTDGEAAPLPVYGTTVELENGSDDSPEPYDEDECKRILRSHKLKIVVLEDFAQKSGEVPKKKLKKRKKEEELSGKEKKKEGKSQLFPPPLTSFAQLTTRYGINRRLADNVKEQGYKMPTEVQLGALPLLLGGKQQKSLPHASVLAADVDLLTVAPTGSGKTIAFLIPIIDSLLSKSESKGEPSEGPRAVVIAPTRELASQIVNEARKLSKGTGIKAALMKKGMEVIERAQDDTPQEHLTSSEDEEDGASDSGEDWKMVRRTKPKRRQAERVKAAILVATPLALLNAIKHSNGTISSLPSIRHLVLDEADVLLDPLFRDQTLSIWNACTNPHLCVGLWSATMGSNIDALTLSTLNTRWATLSSSRSNTPLPPRPPLLRLVVGLKDSALPTITHKLIYAATEQGKLLGLRQLLHPTSLPSNPNTPSLRPPFLIFTQTIPRAMALHSELRYDIPPEAGGSSRIAVLHASLGSAARASTLARFRAGDIWVLITTDLLSRGLDFRGLNGVVNYDVPTSAAAYVHRVGRTGRAGREGGVAVTFYTSEDVPHVRGVANVIRASEEMGGGGGGGGKGSGSGVEKWLLDALPVPSRRDKQRLKRRGVEARRAGAEGKKGGGGNVRISTKSGYERRLEGRKRGARMGSARRKGEEGRVKEAMSESEFEGFDA
ncbi:P-loop containing nucleoside triphosphate hydrolase protein [Polyplosphaeria fusca]|uniref:ATP-dependent RNA helicase ROK1 n=1 Tax=Polyplosphaeria fusca TaxID=682080 RepID=A0A9P4R411_9PLEO|nr:P-loop containing nucleoside triphosphate hydrolase protein [Polyplosphaeria fusca]